MDEIFSVLFQVAAMVDELEQGKALIAQMRAEIERIRQETARWVKRPKVYFEEWDEPRISAIRWVSELTGIAGGLDIFPDLALQPLGKDRILPNDDRILAAAPDIIIGSWCGKKFRPERVAARTGWADVPAVRNGQLFEIKSADILQPGPAALTDGLRQLHQIMAQWAQRHG